MKDNGTKTSSTLIHDPSKRCLLDLRGANLTGRDLPGWPVGGSSVVVSVEGMVVVTVCGVSSVVESPLYLQDEGGCC